MELHEIVNKDDILNEAFKHPTLKIKPRGKKPDIEVANKAILKTIELMAVRALKEQVHPVIEDAYNAQVFTDGEWADCADQSAKDEWESAMDDRIETAIEDYTANLSADWLAQNTIACSLHVEDGVNKYAESMAKELYKQATYGKTPVKIMSNAGIVSKDVEERLGLHIENPPTQDEEEEMAQERTATTDEVLHDIIAHVGKDFDIMTVHGDLDLASDDDDILANGAAGRLGIDEAGIEALRIERLEHEDNTADVLLERLQAVSTEKKRKPASSKKTKEKAVEAEEREGIMDPAIMVALKDCGGVKDTDMASGLGISRATYNNYVNGKSDFVPTAEQYTYLRDTLLEKANGLAKALAQLDGLPEAEAHEFF